MSIEGHLHLFTSARPSQPEQFLDEALRLSGAKAASAWSTPSDISEWDLFQSNLSKDDDLDEISVDTIGSGIPIEKAAAMWNKNICLRLDMANTSLDTGLAEAVTQIPVEILNGFRLARGFSVWLGQHDIFESAEHDEGYLFGRSFFSVVFTGFGCPNDWEETRRRIFEIPELQRIKNAYEQIAGPLQQCMYWSV